MSRGMTPGQTPVTVTGVPAGDDNSDIGPGPQPEHPVAAGAQTTEFQRQSSSSSVMATETYTSKGIQVNEKDLDEEASDVSGTQSQFPSATPPSWTPYREAEAKSWWGSGWTTYQWTDYQWNSGQAGGSQQWDPGLASGSQTGDQWTTSKDYRSTDWKQRYWEMTTGDNDWKCRDEPDLSHLDDTLDLSYLDTPSFSGNKEEFMTYRGAALKFKSQM